MIPTLTAPHTPVASVGKAVIRAGSPLSPPLRVCLVHDGGNKATITNQQKSYGISLLTFGF
ncbi:hypothetical protein [Scytonema sp. PRP1]|uniref:hypothetical protein n=1 Tax=Scytonema sp. PRP1 TaxID=3120513 RepID=UPI002FD3B976